MKVWVYVEGVSDRIGLGTLWESWCSMLRKAGWGMRIIPLDDKDRFLKRIGHRAAEKLASDDEDLVVGLPDLYPSRLDPMSPYRHEDLRQLSEVQGRLVGESLRTKFGLSSRRTEMALERLHASALKHDLEMLLLAAREQLRDYLGTRESLGNWRQPVEEQDQGRPPRRIVEELFRTKRGVGYRDTVHAGAVLSKVSSMRSLLWSDDGQLQCPAFKDVVDWMGTMTGVRAYS